MFLTAGFFALIWSSWLLRIRIGVFLDENAYRGALSNPLELANHTPDSTLLGLLALFLCGLLPAIIIEKLSGRFWKGPLLLGALSLLSAYLVVVAVPKSNMEPAEFNHYRLFLRNSVSPQFTLVWGKLAGATWESGGQVTLPLLRRPILASDGMPALEKGYRPKNVVIIIAEAMRLDLLDAFGGMEKVMPNTNRLAREGLVFRGIAQSSESTYSKLAILLGVYPLMNSYRSMFQYDEYPFERIYDRLKSLGYEAASFNSAGDHWQNLERILRTPSLDPYLDYGKLLGAKYGRLDQARVLFPELQAWIARTHAQKKHFYAQVTSEATHFPFDQDFPSKHVLFEPNEILAQTLAFEDYPRSFSTVMHNRYLNVFNFFDSLIGELVDFLVQSGLADDTVLVIVGDHGEMFHEHGLVNHASELFQPVLEVPIIFWSGSKFAAQARNDWPVAQIDIIPSLYTILGLQASPAFQGRSVFHQRGNTSLSDNHRGPIFASIQSLAHQDALVDWPWKLIADYRKGTDRLYNLSSDPSEEHDLAQRESARFRCLRGMLTSYRSNQLGYYDPQNRMFQEFLPPDYAQQGNCPE